MEEGVLWGTAAMGMCATFALQMNCCRWREPVGYKNTAVSPPRTLAASALAKGNAAVLSASRFSASALNKPSSFPSCSCSCCCCSSSSSSLDFCRAQTASCYSAQQVRKHMLLTGVRDRSGITKHFALCTPL